VLPELRPRKLWCSSYDLPSHGPTREALQRLKAERVLPAYSVPGKYAPIVYEEAALLRHDRVRHYRSEGKWKKLYPEELDAARALAFIEVEAYLQGVTEGHDEACTIVPGLLALPDILEPKWRLALGEDMREFLDSPAPARRASTVWVFALAVPALLRAAACTNDEVKSAQAALDAVTIQALEEMLLEEFKTRRGILDALAINGIFSVEIGMERFEWRADQGSFESDTPIYSEDYDTILKLIEHWCPSSAQRLRAPLRLSWTEPQAELEIRPHGKNPLWGHAVVFAG
ncbi:MAG: hypothetical protein AAF368_19305, partial [Planctomycetota bacterium]